MSARAWALWTVAMGSMLATSVGGCGGGSSSSSGDGGTTASSSSGSSSGSTSSSSSGGGSGSSSGSSSGSGGSSGSSGSSSGGAAPTGVVKVEQCLGPSAICTVPALFIISAEFGAQYSCTSVPYGGCNYYTCTSNSITGGQSAGTISVSGGSIPTGTTATPASDNTYYSSLMGSYFSAGDTITISASGATVPAWGPDAFTVAPAVTLTAPQLDASGNGTVPSSSDLTVSWTGGQSGATMVFQMFPSSTTLQYAACIWDASPGQGTVSQAILSKLSGLGEVSFLWGQEVKKTFTATSNTIEEIVWQYTGQTATVQ